MNLAPVRYTRPEGLAEAIDALGSEPGARALAGGQTLLNVLKLRAATVDLLVDISRLDELRGIAPAAGGALEIGAAVTYAELARSEAVRAAHPRLAEVAGALVDRQVRARGTVGGNACLNDPLSNLPPLLTAMAATFRIASSSGDREVAAEEFFVAPYTTAVGPGELLRSIVVPGAPEGAGVGYASLQVAPDSWALARAAVRVAGIGIVEEARIVLGCVGPRPLRQPAAEAAVVGRPRAEVDPAAVAALTGEGAEPCDDVHATGAYRLEMSRVMAERALRQALDDGKEPHV